jgi:hypothetical protein
MQRHVAEDIYVRQPPACQLWTMLILASDSAGWGQFAVLKGFEAKPGIVGWKGILAQSRAIHAQIGTGFHNLAQLEGDDQRENDRLSVVDRGLNVALARFRAVQVQFGTV